MTLFTTAFRLGRLPPTLNSVKGSTLLKWTQNPLDIVAYPVLTTGHRHLYAASALGLDGFASKRERIAMQFKGIEDKFKQRMKEVTLTAGSENLIFTEDLQNAVHLMESTEEDMSLIVEMSKKFNNQNKGLRFGAFVFGPVVARMFYHLNQPEMLYKVMKMEELDGFFDQKMSYHIALDLLYENELHQEVLDIFSNLQEKRLNGEKYPKNCLTIALGTCYKLNTPESYETMVDILRGAQEYGTELNLRCIIFAAALALKQNFAHVCIEILSKSKNVKQEGVRNLKLLAMTELGRLQDILPILRSVIQSDLPDTSRHRKISLIYKDTMEKIRQAVHETGDKELIAEFQHTSKNLEVNGFISEKMLHDHVCEPIAPFKLEERRYQDRAMLAASFNRNSRNSRSQQSRFRPRPGLMDME